MSFKESGTVGSRVNRDAPEHCAPASSSLDDVVSASESELLSSGPSVLTSFANVFFEVNDDSGNISL